MPEGDTVWQAARRLHRALAAHLLLRSDLRVPAHATADLTGRTVLDVTPRGKHLLTRLEGGLTLHSHLGMVGAWRVYGPDERWRGGPGHQIRVILGTEGATAVGYRLPVVELLRTADEHRVVGHLGPDLLGPDWDAGTALRRLRSDAARPLGAALLDQRNLAGIGNVYQAELCFLGKVTPWLPVGELAEDALARLVALAHTLLTANRERPARSTTGRRTQRLFVYGRAPRPCLRCGTSIRVADQDWGHLSRPGGGVHGGNPRPRPTYWCPSCQRGPAPPPGDSTGVARTADPTERPW